ncbi:hypothetical protein SCP_0503740 [Sparassis crispa]|uniref:Uncharacterized protein n=1 Tax=Sparassis crispa TaxID=139825 RepID=A0A401GMA2_9APHY|nr:hypothetical protein SCP_0503740 [Sparassis crispa]GBE83326.1 hypothetical protein SCP_0503740 [Sparassis crispa]
MMAQLHILRFSLFRMAVLKRKGRYGATERTDAAVYGAKEDDGLAIHDRSDVDPV